MKLNSAVVISREHDFNPDGEIDKLREDHENSSILNENIDEEAIVNNDIKGFENTANSVEIEEKEYHFKSGTEYEPTFR